MLFRALEAAAACVGLSINFGPGKTERFVIAADPGVVTDSKGQRVPVVPHYKYLGVFATDAWTDLEKRKTKCWAALLSLKHLWKSNLRMPYKRDLAYALIEPIMSYGIGAWPLTREYEDAIDGAFGRMLRYACGLPPAFVSRELVPTEKLYGDHPFMSTHIRTRRISLLAHTFRATASGRINHPFVHLFFWEVPVELYQNRRGGQRLTLQRSILRDCECEFVEQLLPLFADNNRTAELIKHVTLTTQAAKMSRSALRREHAADNRTVLDIARKLNWQRPGSSITAPVS